MGYYSTFYIEVVNARRDEIPRQEIEKAAIRLAEIMGEDKSWSNYKTDIPSLNDPFDWVMDDCMKWYNHSEDMSQLASEFPHLVFLLEGHGEDRDDNWREFFQGDRYDRRKMYWEPSPEWADIAPF